VAWAAIESGRASIVTTAQGSQRPSRAELPMFLRVATGHGQLGPKSIWIGESIVTNQARPLLSAAHATRTSARVQFRYFVGKFIRSLPFQAKYPAHVQFFTELS
jgi:hypothetical protein